VFRRSWLAACVLSAVVAVGASAAENSKPDVIAFGTLKAASADVVRGQALEWLTASGKADDATRKQFDAIWGKADSALLEKIADTLSLDTTAATILKDAADITKSVPKEVPAALKDTKQNNFYRANLALLFAKSISNRRVYEEALEALKTVRPEYVADPSAYFFYRSVAAHALMKKDEAAQSIIRLLDDVADAPDRYKMVATLMFFDMQSWKPDEKDLTNISKLMDNSGRRLDLARGGKITQDIQKKIVFRLDEVIKELENQAKGNCNCNGGQCPGGQPGNNPGNTNTPSSPQNDSFGGKNSGDGKVDEKKLKELAENWGKLPEKERAKAMMELTKDLPPRYREIIENYAKTIARGSK